MADMNVNVTTSKTEGNDLSPEMKVFYRTQLLQNARAEHYYAQFAQKQGLPKNSGNTVEWRKMDTFAKAMTPLTEGVTPAGNKANMIKIEGKIDQYGDFTAVSDRLSVEAVDPIVSMITEEHGAQAGDTLDALCRNEIVAGTNVLYAPNGDTEVTSRADITKSCKMTPTLVDKAVTILKKARAPKINGYYVAIIHPSVAFDLRESEGWLEAHKYAKPEEIYNGEIGQLHGVRFVESPDAKIWKTTNGAVYATMFLGLNAYGLIDPDSEALEVIVKGLGSGGTNDPLNQRSTVGWKASTGTKILYQERMLRVESGSSFSDTDEEN